MPNGGDSVPQSSWKTEVQQKVQLSYPDPVLQDPENGKAKSCHHQGIQEISPDGLPPGAADADLQGGDVVRHDVQVVARHCHQGSQAYKDIILFHGAEELEFKIETQVENALDRVLHTIVTHFDVPQVKVGEGPEVLSAHIEAEGRERILGYGESG